MSYPRAYFDPMYLTPRQAKNRGLTAKRRMYPVQRPVQKEEAVTEDQESIGAVDRSRFKRQVRIVDHRATVEPEPIDDFLPLQVDKAPAVLTAVPVEPVPEVPTRTQATQVTVFEKQLSSAPVKTKKSRLKLKSTHIFAGMAVAVFIAGMTVAFLGFRTNQVVGGQVQGSSTQGPSGADESAPALGDYVVAPHLPRYISINKIGVKGRVLKVGVDASGQLQAPNNVHDAGWYESSALPGDAGGAMVVDGHAYGPTKPGIFDKLETLSEGDQIQIERGDGQVFNFQVVKTASFHKDSVDMASMMVSADTSKLGLNLITCSGKFNPGTNDYDQRHVVYAVAM